jgi:predicted GIY-YIG superfamily endonuclease
VGYTHLPVSQRLTRHNEGAVPSTANHRPWRLAFACAFPNKQQALDFERYLKSHSGKAFTAKHLL